MASDAGIAKGRSTTDSVRQRVAGKATRRSSGLKKIRTSRHRFTVLGTKNIETAANTTIDTATTASIVLPAAQLSGAHNPAADGEPEQHGASIWWSVTGRELFPAVLLHPGFARAGPGRAFVPDTQVPVRVSQAALQRTGQEPQSGDEPDGAGQSVSAATTTGHLIAGSVHLPITTMNE
jgi:hypothetical protein